MSEPTSALAVVEPGDLNNQIEVIAGDARQALEDAWQLLNTDTPPDSLTQNTVQALVITAHQRVEQLEKFGEAAVAAVASVMEAMKVVEEQRDEAVENMVEAEEKVAEIVSEIDARVERQVEMEMEYAEEYMMDSIDWAELRQEAEENFDSEVEYTAMRLKGLGEAEAAEDLMKQLREAKRLRIEVARLAEQYDRFVSEKDREKRQQEWAERHPGEANNPYDYKPVTVEDNDDDEDFEDDPDLDDEGDSAA